VNAQTRTSLSTHARLLGAQAVVAAVLAVYIATLGPIRLFNGGTTDLGPFLQILVAAAFVFQALLTSLFVLLSPRQSGMAVMVIHLIAPGVGLLVLFLLAAMAG
jgi:hypothetical protein